MYNLLHRYFHYLIIVVVVGFAPTISLSYYMIERVSAYSPLNQPLVS
nr:MAG TPA: hypothetical protein [Crassvirales sp.]